MAFLSSSIQIIAKLAGAYLDLSAKACTTRRNGLFRENYWDWKAEFQSLICWNYILLYSLEVGRAFIICSRPDLSLRELKISTLLLQ
jgi:hypothetical protein